MLKKIRDAIASDNELSSETLRLVSLACLLLSGIMSLLEYTREIKWWLDQSITFQPELIATVIAIFLVAPLYMRGILKWSKSIYSLVSFILILLVFASFTQLALGGDEKSTVVISLIGASILLSWVGIKEIAGISWLLAFSAGLYAIVTNSYTMGIYGFIYITSGFIGLVLHSGLSPSDLLKGIKDEYSSSTDSIMSTAKNDINATAEKVT